MRKSLLLMLGLIACSCAAAEVPEILKEGFDTYKDKGGAAAVEQWLRGSALDGDRTSRLQVLGVMTQLEAAYGKFESYEVIGESAPTSRLKRVYTVSYHAKGPIFAYFDLYATQSGWVIYMFLFNTKPQEILPRQLLDKNG